MSSVTTQARPDREHQGPNNQPTYRLRISDGETNSDQPPTRPNLGPTLNIVIAVAVATLAVIAVAATNAQPILSVLTGQ